MVETPDVVMFRIPLCGRCRQVEANLAQLKKNRPTLSVQIYTLPDHMSEASKYHILNMPLVVIKGKPYGGVLSAEEIAAALDAPA